MDHRIPMNLKYKLIKQEEKRSPRKIYFILIYFSIYDTSPSIISSLLVDNKICMTTNIDAVVTKLCELFILDTAALYE